MHKLSQFRQWFVEKIKKVILKIKNKIREEKRI